MQSERGKDLAMERVRLKDLQDCTKMASLNDQDLDRCKKLANDKREKSAQLILEEL